MKPARLATLWLLSACGGGEGAALPDAAPISDAAPAPDAACLAVPRCSFEVRHYAPSATSVELRGDFTPGGWESGVTMERQGDEFVATLSDLADGTSFEYKLVVDGVWTMDPESPRSVPDGAGGRNSVAYVDCDGCPTAAFDWRDALLYFVLVDRFANGDPGNDAPVAGVEAPANFQGGDLQGVLGKLREGYFEELGVNALWLSCPLTNALAAGSGRDGRMYAAYHGYWPRELETIDPRVGNEALLAEVIDEAHARGLKVILDYVMNHVHDESALYAEHRDWFWPGPAEGGCICGDGCSWDSDADRFRCWFRPYLPDFDFRNQAARYYSVVNAAAWAQRLGLDGYRLDAVKHVETSWLTELRERLSARVVPDGRSFYLVGETFSGDRGLLKSYIDPATKLDGQFDFPQRAAILRHLLMRQGTVAELMAFLDDNDAFYPPGTVMGTFLGNHDLPRVVHLAEEPPQFSEWDGGADRAWSNPPQTVVDREAYERLAVAYALLLTTPGAPLIYYGDEYGMPGGGDPDNRRMMRWDGWSEPQLWLRGRIAAYGRVRAEKAVLRRGRRVTRGASADGAVYAMVNGAVKVWVAINRGDHPVPAEGLPAGRYLDLVDGGTVSAPLDLAPRSALILEEE